MENKGLSAKRITALLCVLVFSMSLVLTGCQIGSSDEGKTTTTTTTAAQALEYIEPEDVEVQCPKCGSTNVDDAWREGEEYDEHYICYDCDYEWYVVNGVAYEIKDNGQSATVPNYTYRPGYVHNSSSSNSSSGNKGNSSNSNKTTTTTTTTKSGTNLTMDDVEELADYISSGKWLNEINWYIDEEGNITTEGDKGVLGFGYSTKDKCFYATGNAWQRDYGYNELYDKTSQFIAISYDTINVYFTYKNKEWMVQFWKGQYGMVLIGAEIGVYNRTLAAGANDTGLNHYNAVKDSERLPISLTLYQNDKVLFSRPQKLNWWQTGFVPGQLGVTAGVLVGSTYTNDLSVTTSITLDNAEMTQAFIGGLEAVTRIYNNVDAMNANDTSAGYRSFSFKPGDGVTPGTYSVSGNTVKLTWQ
ncbi:MAG: DUF4474 domain-containing protein [Clostridia bacterium]|nr:DUF4474 domain-containing protein [Clostridia bacterium]